MCVCVCVYILYVRRYGAHDLCIRAIFSWTRTEADRNSERKHQSADTMSVTLQVLDACNIRDAAGPRLPRSRSAPRVLTPPPTRCSAQGVLISQSAKCLFCPHHHGHRSRLLLFIIIHFCAHTAAAAAPLRCKIIVHCTRF